MRWLMLSAVPLLVAAPAFATMATRAELPELVAKSDLVVLGTAGKPTSRWEGSRIVTVTTVVVEEVWTGSAPSTIEVTTLGGVVDGIGQHVSGALRLQTGERLVLCLQKHAGRLRVVEMSQGAFFVEQSAPTADPVVRRRGFGLQLRGAPAELMPVTLRALERAVREADHARR